MSKLSPFEREVKEAYELLLKSEFMREFEKDPNNIAYTTALKLAGEACVIDLADRDDDVVKMYTTLGKGLVGGLGNSE